MSLSASPAELGEEALPRAVARPGLPLAIVVGAGALGMAIARRLGRENRLLLVDRDAAHLANAATALVGEGHDVAPITCDITDRAQVDAVAAHAAKCGPVGVLAHVVGLSPSMGDGRRVMSVNLVGAAYMCEAIRPLSVPGTVGVFVASIAGHHQVPSPQLVAILDDPLKPDFLHRIDEAMGGLSSAEAYWLSKFALIRMCRRQAVSWAVHGARIVSLSPGLISTPMGDREFAHRPSKFAAVKRTPLARQGSMLEVAEALAFLASDRASFITGTDLLIDGGLASVESP